MTYDKVKLSQHFMLSEFTKSATAEKFKIDNNPNIQQVVNMCNLCIKVLEPLRKVFGAIVITSGFRSKELNKAVGGTKNSQHTKGEAADIRIINNDVGMRMFEFIKNNTDFDQLLLEYSLSKKSCWIHVSCKHNSQENRFQTIKNYATK